MKTKADRPSDNKVPPALAPHWMNLKEACDELCMTRQTVGKKVKAGILDRMKYKRNTLIGRASVARYLDQFKID